MRLTFPFFCRREVVCMRPARTDVRGASISEGRPGAARRNIAQAPHRVRMLSISRIGGSRMRVSRKLVPVEIVRNRSPEPTDHLGISKVRKAMVRRSRNDGTGGNRKCRSVDD